MFISLGSKASQQVVKLANLSPTMQRFAIGATGLVSHTTIDALNPYVDEDTRKYAAVRSAIKMVICTVSGMFARSLGQKLGELAVNSRKFIVPEGMSKAVYAGSVGKVFAICGAIASVFLIDVPFLNKTLNLVMEKFFNTKKPDHYGEPKKVNCHG